MVGLYRPAVCAVWHTWLGDMELVGLQTATKVQCVWGCFGGELFFGAGWFIEMTQLRLAVQEPYYGQFYGNWNA